MRIGYLTYIIIILWSAVLGGCTTVKQTNEATESTQRFAHQTDKFHLARWDYHLDPDSKRLTIFIEGDGQAFTRTGKPSLDPTPVHPIAQQLAAMTLQSIALGRPCQFYKERDAS